MSVLPANPRIPRAAIQRLALCVQLLGNLSRDKVEIVSSADLADACGVPASQVRKDLSHFGELGIRGKGYNVSTLLRSISASLSIDREWRMALIGVGNLGKALLNHGEFRKRRFNIVALFDCDPFKIGETVRNLEVRCTQDLRRVVEEQEIEIGIITTPPERAQTAAQHLIDAGLTSILNFAPSRIKVPAHVHVEHVDFFNHLYALAFTHA